MHMYIVECLIYGQDDEESDGRKQVFKAELQKKIKEEGRVF